MDPQRATTPATPKEATAYLSSTLSHCRNTQKTIAQWRTIVVAQDKIWLLAIYIYIRFSLVLTASCKPLTASGSSVPATSAGASPVAIATTFRAKFLSGTAKIRSNWAFCAYI